MTDYFYQHQIRIFDYPKWAEAMREALRENMERLAADSAIEIEFVRSRKSFRKEDRVKAGAGKSNRSSRWRSTTQVRSPG